VTGGWPERLSARQGRRGRFGRGWWLGLRVRKKIGKHGSTGLSLQYQKSGQTDAGDDAFANGRNRGHPGRVEVAGAFHVQS